MYDDQDDDLALYAADQDIYNPNLCPHCHRWECAYPAADCPVLEQMWKELWKEEAKERADQAAESLS